MRGQTNSFSLQFKAFAASNAKIFAPNMSHRLSAMFGPQHLLRKQRVVLFVFLEHPNLSAFVQRQMKPNFIFRCFFYLIHQSDSKQTADCP